MKSTIIIAFAIAAVALTAHRPDRIAGQTSGVLAAPTSVLATDGLYNNKVGIYWDTIRGATSYRIFRGVSDLPSVAADIGTTQANFFFDQTAAPGQTSFYWVRAENGGDVSELSSGDQGTRAVGVQQGPVAPLAPPGTGPLANQVTATKAFLGKTLFWDEQMSSTGTVSCGTCHHSGTGGTDPRSATSAVNSTNPGPDSLPGTADDVRGSAGVPVNNADGTYVFDQGYGLNDQVTGRKSVSYLNAVYSPLLFWDGRATGVFRDPISNVVLLNGGGALESQAVGPPVSTGEMAHSGRNWNDVAARISRVKPLALSPNIPLPLNTWIGGRTYPELFLEAFGTAEVTPARIAMAIGSFERTLFTDQTPFDLLNAGISPLTAAEQRGRNIFNANGCNTCHGASLLTDNNFHYLGVRPDTEDIAREQITGFPNDRGAFRTPSLRNVELRGSYFHNGRFTTLEQVVDFYDRGGDFDANNKPNIIRPIGLNPQQRADLVTFLKRPLTDPRVTAEAGPFSRPALYMESNRVPEIIGTGLAGSGGLVPQIRVISPPIAGNPNFTVSVSGALGNSEAVLVIDSSDPSLGGTIPKNGSLARVVSSTHATGAGNGWTSISLAIPRSVGVVGQTFFARWYIEDSGAINGFSVSQAARFTVFGEPEASVDVSISGRVLTLDGLGIRNATVVITDNNGVTLRATTSTFGFYVFENVPTGANYSIGVSSRRFRCAPTSMFVTDNVTELNFIAQE
ncbi:MAG: cytochrome c peroxidase [Pyrinomonadaceae bacterium]